MIRKAIGLVALLGTLAFGAGGCDSTHKSAGEYACEKEPNGSIWARDGNKTVKVDYETYANGSFKKTLEIWNMPYEEAAKAIRACEEVFKKKLPAEKE